MQRHRQRRYFAVSKELELVLTGTGGTVNLSNSINSKVLVSYDSIKVDSNIPFASDSDHQRIFPNSIKNMRRRIRGVGERDREFLPLWMRPGNYPVDWYCRYSFLLGKC